jgi:CRISPR system Cascade subunit CasC
VGRILARAVTAPNRALFGRMVELKADSPFGKLYLDVDAACQVAHAISTNRMNIEFDFYTAVDDLLPQEDSGAGMMGDVQFASACMYRYANVNMRQLEENLGGNTPLARQTLQAFLEAAIRAIPSGHQNSMAAHNLPSFVLAVARLRPASLQNAFAKPVRPDETMDLVDASVKALDTYWGQSSRMFGRRDIGGAWCCALNEEVITHLTPALVPSVDEVIGNIVAAASKAEAAPVQEEVVV